jgi:hypothetical protein
MMIPAAFDSNQTPRQKKIHHLSKINREIQSVVHRMRVGLNDFYKKNTGEFECSLKESMSDRPKKTHRKRMK